MAIVTVSALIDVLRRVPLLTPEQLGGVQRMARNRRTDPRLVARALMQRGWLTVYQVNQLLAGHGPELILGPYHLLDRLGQGGQSLVFKARHAEQGWIVALKVIRHELLDSSEARQQFLSEMEAMAQLDHPNVVEFWDAGEAGQTFYCAMEFVEGTDLGKLVRLTGMLPPAQACDYIRQTATGLQHAHERNLIHRDIKPVNLILTSPPAPKVAPILARLNTQPAAPPPAIIKILDWGLACLRPPSERQTGPSNATPTRAIIGTADYLSPEQARNADNADIRSDIYSLGCTFYYLLTGRPPFPGGSLMQKLIQHQRAEPAPVESLNPEVPPALAALVRRMMAKNPEERFQTPAAVALALAPFVRNSTGSSGMIRRDPRLTQALEAKAPQEDTPIPSVLRTTSLISPHPGVAAKAPAPQSTAKRLS
jgi:eukaryotic-like serine/threonine-protein kinase